MGVGVSPTPWPPLPPGKTRYPLYRRLGGPQGRSGRAENLVPTGIRSQTVQPVISRYTDWATRPTHFTSFFLKFKSNLLVKRTFMLVECCFGYTIPGFNFSCTSCNISYHATKKAEIFHILQLCLIYHNVSWDGCLEIPMTSVLSTFIFVPQHLPISFRLSITPCSTVPSLASSTNSSTYFTHPIAFPILNLQTLQELPWLRLRLHMQSKYTVKCPRN